MRERGKFGQSQRKMQVQKKDRGEKAFHYHSQVEPSHSSIFPNLRRNLLQHLVNPFNGWLSTAKYWSPVLSLPAGNGIVNGGWVRQQRVATNFRLISTNRGGLAHTHLAKVCSVVKLHWERQISTTGEHVALQDAIMSKHAANAFGRHEEHLACGHSDMLTLSIAGRSNHSNIKA